MPLRLARPILPPPQRPVLLLAMDYYEPAAHEGIMDWVREHDWRLDASSVRFCTRPSFTVVSGILTTVLHTKTPGWLRKFGCPIVRLLETASPELEEACSDLPVVLRDFHSAGRLGAEHLLTLGQAHFVFDLRGAAGAALRDGFLERMRAAGEEPTVLDYTVDHPLHDPLKPLPIEKRRSWLLGKLRALPRPLAVMTEDDHSAIDLIDAARQLGWRVPQDVAVLGCNDNHFALGVSPIPVSSVDTDVRGVGYAAAGLLARLIGGQPAPAAPLRVPARRVVARHSTATYAGAHPALGAVLQRIRLQFRQPLSLPALARGARLSVRGLQHAFKREMGYTIQEELMRLRVSAAVQLLETSDLKLDAVAAETNLGDAKNLCRVFAKVHGISPTHWRRTRGRAET